MTARGAKRRPTPAEQKLAELRALLVTRLPPGISQGALDGFIERQATQLLALLDAEEPEDDAPPKSILVAVPPPPEEEVPTPKRPIVPAGAGDLEFSVNTAELRGALNLIRRVADPADPNLAHVQIECHGHVVLRLGSTDQYFELRLESVKCKASGHAAVAIKQLMQASKSLGKGRVTLRKAAGDETMEFITEGKSLAIPAVDYTPIDLLSEGRAVLDLPADVLLRLIDRTAFAISREAHRVNLYMARLESLDGRLSMLTTNGFMGTIAGIPTRTVPALHGTQISTDAIDRLQLLLKELVAVTRKGGAKDSPVVRLLVAPDAKARRRLIVRSDLFTFAAAQVEATFPPLERVVPAVASFDGVCVVPLQGLADVLKDIQRGKGKADLHFGKVVRVTSTPDPDGPRVAAELADGFRAGPPSMMRFDPAFLLPAVLAAGTEDEKYVGLAYNSHDQIAPLVIFRWPARRKPSEAKYAFGRLHDSLRAHEWILVMPMRM